MNASRIEYDIYDHNLVEKERFSNPLKDELRMSCANAVQLIDFFVNIHRVPLDKILNDLSVDEEYLQDTSNWLNNYDTYKLYYNCHHSLTGFTHKDWIKVGQDIYTGNASAYFKTLLRLIPLKKVYNKVPSFNERLSSSSRYIILDQRKGTISYKYEILVPEVRSLYSIGCECYWHLGILRAVPKIQNPSDSFTQAKHEICSMKIGHILRGCYNIFEPDYEYRMEGLFFNAKLVGKWVRLRPNPEYPHILSRNYDFVEAAEANAMVIDSDVFINGTKAFERGEIYNAPYCIFRLKYNEVNFLKRFFIKQRISTDVLEDQLRKTEAKFVEAENLRQREKEANLNLEKAHKKLQEYSDLLADMVDERTKELRETQSKLLEAEKRTLEHRITGGFAHEMRNALSGAQLEFNTILNYRNKGKPSAQILKDSVTSLLKNITLIHEEFDIPREKIADQLIPELKIIAEIADHLSDVHSGVSRDLDRGLSITTQIRDYAKMSEMKPGDTPVDIVALLKEYTDRYRQDFERIGITYTVEGMDKAIVKADEIHINSILSNLILNARDALEEQGGEGKKIRVTVERKDDEDSSYFIIKVQDNGPGIPEAHLNEIFEPFFSTKPTFGTGLGLGVVRRMVQLYEGQIEVESMEGEGTTFMVILPCDILANRVKSELR